MRSACLLGLSAEARLFAALGKAQAPMNSGRVIALDDDRLSLCGCSCWRAGCQLRVLSPNARHAGLRRLVRLSSCVCVHLLSGAAFSGCGAVPAQVSRDFVRLRLPLAWLHSFGASPLGCCLAVIRLRPVSACAVSACGAFNCLIGPSVFSRSCFLALRERPLFYRRVPASVEAQGHLCLALSTSALTLSTQRFPVADISAVPGRSHVSSSFITGTQIMIALRPARAAGPPCVHIVFHGSAHQSIDMLYDGHIKPPCRQTSEATRKRRSPFAEPSRSCSPAGSWSRIP